MQRILEAFQSNLPTFLDQAVDRVIAAKIKAYQSFPREILNAAIGRAYAAVGADLEKGTNTAFGDYLSSVSAQRAEQGATVQEILHGINLGLDVLKEYFQQAFADDPEALIWWMGRIHQIVYEGTIRLADAILNVREQIIRQQASQIQELSTPIIPLSRGVLVVPLIGTITAQRAAKITENMLEAIGQQHAEVVLIDVTGVPVVDTNVANYLIQAARAASLLGSDVLLVGIRPEIAQTIVQLGVDLSGVRTEGNLQAGVEYALNRQRRK